MANTTFCHKLELYFIISFCNKYFIIFFCPNTFRPDHVPTSPLFTQARPGHVLSSPGHFNMPPPLTPTHYWVGDWLGALDSRGGTSGEDTRTSIRPSPLGERRAFPVKQTLKYNAGYLLHRPGHMFCSGQATF